MPSVTPLNNPATRHTPAPKNSLRRHNPFPYLPGSLWRTMSVFTWPNAVATHDDTFQNTALPGLSSNRLQGLDDTTVVKHVTIVNSTPKADTAVKPFLTQGEQLFLNALAQQHGYINAHEMWQTYYTQIHQQRRLAESLLNVREKITPTAEARYKADLMKRVASSPSQMEINMSDCPDGLTLLETVRLSAALLPSLGFEAKRVTDNPTKSRVLLDFKPIKKGQTGLFEYLNTVDHQVLFPQLPDTSAGAIDFMQGSSGTCWVLSPLYALLNHPVTQRVLLNRITLPNNDRDPFQTTWYQRGMNNAMNLAPLVIQTQAAHLVQEAKTPEAWADPSDTAWQRARVVGPLGIRLFEAAFDLYQGRLSRTAPPPQQSSSLSLWDTLDRQYRERQPFTVAYGGESLPAMKELAHGFNVFSLDEMPWNFPGFFEPPAAKTQIPLWRRITTKARNSGTLGDLPELQEASHLWALHKLFEQPQSEHRYVGVGNTHNTERRAYKHLVRDYKRVGLTPNHSYAMGSVDPVKHEIAWVNPHNTMKKPIVLSFSESATLMGEMVMVDTVSRQAV